MHGLEDRLVVWDTRDGLQQPAVLLGWGRARSHSPLTEAFVRGCSCQLLA